MGASILNPQWQVFADKYLSHGVATTAAIEAGFSKNSARSTGARLLRNTSISDYIQAQQQRIATKTVNRRDKILQELDKLAFANIGDFIRVDEDGLPQVDFSNATPEQLAAITSVSTKKRKIYNPKGDHIATEEAAKFTLSDKLRGLELLGRAEGMFKQDEVKVVVDVADRLLQARQRVQQLTARAVDSDE